MKILKIALFASILFVIFSCKKEKQTLRMDAEACFTTFRDTFNNSYLAGTFDLCDTNFIDDSWDFGDGWRTLPISKYNYPYSVSYIFPDSGIYIVKHKVTDKNGNIKFYSKKITVFYRPYITPDVNLDDISNWQITESIKLLTYRIDSTITNGYTVDTTYEMHTFNTTIRNINNASQFTISNFEYYFPLPLNNTIDNNDVANKVYYFTKDINYINKYGYYVPTDFTLVDGVNFAYITFNNTKNPTSFTAGCFASSSETNSFYMSTMFGTKL